MLTQHELLGNQTQMIAPIVIKTTFQTYERLVVLFWKHGTTSRSYMSGTVQICFDRFIIAIGAMFVTSLFK